MRKFLSLFSFIVFFGFSSNAQDDLLKQLQDGTANSHEKVTATFKGNKIINIQTTETLKKKNLDFRVAHLFGNVGAESGGGIHNLYGLDQSSDIRIAFHYGITDNIMIGVSRTKRNENFEGLVKAKLMQQTTDNKIPLGIGLYAASTVTGKPSVYITKFSHRVTYFTQLLLVRKFSSRFSFIAAPSFLHRNLVDAGDDNDIINLAVGTRFRFTRSSSIILDYFYNIDRTLTDAYKTSKNFTDPLGIGVEIETGGHVFTLMFTNASGTIENDFIATTNDDWAKGGTKFAFNISRTFKVGK